MVATHVFFAFPLLLLLRNRLVTLLKLPMLRGVEGWHGACYEWAKACKEMITAHLSSF
jgi:hypothetical protein